MTTLLTGASALDSFVQTSTTADHSAAIRSALDRQAAAWNRKDAEAFCADFLEDASFINVRGDFVCGRNAIVKVHAFIFAGPYKDTRLDTQVDSIVYPAPTVAIVDTVMTVTGFSILPPGLVPTEPGTLRTRMRFVFVDRGGQWKIVAGQNTAISPAKMEIK